MWSSTQLSGNFNPGFTVEIIKHLSSNTHFLVQKNTVLFKVSRKLVEVVCMYV